MRIAFLSDNFGGGVLTHLVEFSRYCATVGDEVHILSFPHSTLADPLRREDLDATTYAQLRRVPQSDRAADWRMVARFARDIRPDVYLLSKGWAGSPDARLEARLRWHAPLVTIEHSAPPAPPPLPRIAWSGWRPRLALHRRIPAAVQRLRWRFPTRVVVPSNVARTRLIEEWGAPPRKLHVVPLGVDTTRFTPDAPTRQRDPRQLLIGMVSRADIEVKGIDTAFAALALVRQQIPDVRLRFIGDDALSRPALAALAERSGVVDLVEFVGPAHGPALVAAFQGVDLHLIASRHEAGPTTLLEAMACGVPCVATPVGMVPDVIRDGIDGIVVGSSRSAAVLAEGILRWAALSTAERHSMAGSARERVVEQFSSAHAGAALHEQLHRARSKH